eukprot:1312014-Ditylum_brightwellii.AAC.1
MLQNSSSGIKPVLSGRAARNYKLVRLTFCYTIFSCVLDGQFPKAWASASLAALVCASPHYVLDDWLGFFLLELPNSLL